MDAIDATRLSSVSFCHVSLIYHTSSYAQKLDLSKVMIFRSWTNPSNRSNIVAGQAMHSHQNLLPTSYNERAFVLPNEDNDPNIAERQITPGGSGYSVWSWRLDNEFARQARDSPLLDRGWVFQEVLLSAANLFCTDTQMWWSCSHATYSETFPCGYPSTEWPHLEGLLFEDELRSQKRHILSAKHSRSDESNAAIIWSDILTFYTKTSVTLNEDRLVAIHSISRIFRSLWPHQLGEATYHSGLWSSDVISQINWTVNRLHIPPHRLHSTFYLPSWSPMSVGADTGFFSDSDGAQSLLPNQFVAWDTNRLDAFGRARIREDCVLHLRGILTNMALTSLSSDKFDSDNLMSNLRHMEDPQVHTYIRWDTAEDYKIAISTSAATSHKILWTQLSPQRHFMFGLLLRPIVESSTKSASTRQLWIRCGSVYTDAYTLTNAVPDMIEDAKVWTQLFEKFCPLSRYGLRLTYRLGPSQKVECVSESNGLEPDLDDIFIV